MMKTLGKKCSLICTVILTVSCVAIALAGCAAKKAQSQMSPDQVLKSYFAAVRSQDTGTMEKLSVSESSGTSSSASSSVSTTLSGTDGAEISKLIFSKMETAIEGSPEINGDNASVKVKITSPDTKKIMQDCVTAVFSNALANAFSSSATSSDTSAEFTNMFKDALSKSDVALASTEMNVQLVKKNGQWKVKATDNLADAMAGGMYSYSKSLGSGASSSSAQ